MATCVNGHELAEGAKFCPECGAHVAQDAENQTPPPPPVSSATQAYAFAPAQPEPLSGSDRKKMLPWLVGGAALLIAAVVVVLVVSGGGGQTITGSISLFDPDVGSDCTGSSGYDDIRSGASITIRNETGETLATGNLGAGEFFDGVGCDYPFTVEDVPDADFYRIEVTHRGEVEFSRAEMEQNDWEASLSLGE